MSDSLGETEGHPTEMGAPETPLLSFRVRLCRLKGQCHCPSCPSCCSSGHTALWGDKWRGCGCCPHPTCSLFVLCHVPMSRGSRPRPPRLPAPGGHPGSSPLDQPGLISRPYLEEAPAFPSAQRRGVFRLLRGCRTPARAHPAQGLMACSRRT